jgi:hypothetical protein
MLEPPGPGDEAGDEAGDERRRASCQRQDRERGRALLSRRAAVTMYMANPPRSSGDEGNRDEPEAGNRRIHATRTRVGDSMVLATIGITAPGDSRH